MPVSYKRKRSYNNYGSNKRYRPSSGGFLTNALPFAISAGRMLLGGSKYKKKTSSGQGVTSQYDRKVIYSKKRMPRRQRRTWARFVRKVRAVNLKDLGTRTIIRNNQLTATIPNDNQEILVATLYGRDGSTPTTSQCGHNDIAAIFGNDPTVSPTGKLLFGSAIMDITFTNTSSFLDDSNQNRSIEVDVYELMFTKNSDAASVQALITRGDTNTTTINGINPSINILNRGVTPWEIPDALSIGGIRILKKTKYFLSYGQCATYQMRDARNRVFKKSDIDEADNNFALPYVTRSLLFIYKGVPTADATKVLKTLQVGVTRKYMYKQTESEGDLDNIIP